MNRTIMLLVISDMFVLTGFGLVDPVLSIFIKENLTGGTIFAAGLASMAFIVTKSTVQIFFSKIVDKNDRSFRIKSLILGTLIVSSVPFIYVFSNHVNLIYIAQVVHGVGSGLAFPSWMGIWSRNLNIKQRSFEWSFYSTSTGIGTGCAALIGAEIAELFGFIYTFMIVGIISLLGCIVLLGLEMKNNSRQVS